MARTTMAKPPSSKRSLRDMKLVMSGLHHAAPAKQATGTNEKNNDGDEIDDDLVDAGDDGLHLVHRGEGLQDAEQEAGRHGAGQRAHAANDHHHEAEDQEVHAD